MGSARAWRTEWHLRGCRSVGDCGFSGRQHLDEPGFLDKRVSDHYGNGLFVALGSSGQIQTSPDGFKWTQRGTIGGSVGSLTYGNGVFVAFGNGTMAVSIDGIHWTNLASTVTTRELGNLAYGQGMFVAVGTDGTILYSVDAVRWSAAKTPTSSELVFPGGVAYGAGAFVATEDNGAILTSTNGINWATVTNIGFVEGLLGVAYGDGQFVAVGNSGVILTSTNGNIWTEQNSGVTDQLSGLAYSDGLFVVGDSTTAGVLTSPDGVVWTEQNFGETNAYVLGVLGVAYGNGIFVAVGGEGMIFTSTNGTDWTTNNSGTSGELDGVAYGGGTFLVTGVAGTLLTSTNGADWVSRNSGTVNELYGAAFAQDTFIAVGADGTILQSGALSSLGSQLSPAPGWTNGVFGLSLSAPLGGQWKLQASTNLLNWTSLGIVTITNTPMPFVDTGASNFQQRFYRAVSQ